MAWGMGGRKSLLSWVNFRPAQSQWPRPFSVSLPSRSAPAELSCPPPWMDGPPHFLMIWADDNAETQTNISLLPVHFSCWIEHQVISPLTSYYVQKPCLALPSHPKCSDFPLQITSAQSPTTQPSILKTMVQMIFPKHNWTPGNSKHDEKSGDARIREAPGQKLQGWLSTWPSVCTWWTGTLESVTSGSSKESVPQKSAPAWVQREMRADRGGRLGVPFEGQSWKFSFDI